MRRRTHTHTRAHEARHTDVWDTWRILTRICSRLPLPARAFSYPTYDAYLPALESQKNREYAESFLSARDAKKLQASEAAEAALAAHEAGTSAADSAAAANTGVCIARPLEALEGTVWVRSRVLQYLSSTPAATQTAETAAAFLSASKRLLAERAGTNRMAEEDMRLTVCELIQLLNLRPGSLVEIHRAIEECEERLTEADALALLQLVDETLPKAPPRAGAAEADAEMEA